MGTWGGGWESSFSIVSDSQSRKAKMEIDFIIVQENSQEASVPARRRPHRDRARRQPAALSADQAGRPRPRRSPSPYSASKSWLRPRDPLLRSRSPRDPAPDSGPLSRTPARCLGLGGRAAGKTSLPLLPNKHSCEPGRRETATTTKKNTKISWRESLAGTGSDLGSRLVHEGSLSARA